MRSTTYFRCRSEKVKQHPDRSNNGLVAAEAERMDFDEDRLPKASWERVLEADEFEVENTEDVRSGRSRVRRAQSEVMQLDDEGGLEE